MFAMYKEVQIADTNERFGTGWLPPLPDLRDYTEEQPNIANLAKRLSISRSKKAKASLPAKVDLRQWCSAVENQRSLGSCTAHAAVGIVEYFERRAFGHVRHGQELDLQEIVVACIPQLAHHLLHTVIRIDQ